ncbi:hypothetical protein ACQ4PT_015023 [Festuca glaucescens]
MAQCLRGKGGAAATAAVGDALRKAAPWRLGASASYHHTIQAVPREPAGPRAAARERRNRQRPGRAAHPRRLRARIRCRAPQAPHHRQEAARGDAEGSRPTSSPPPVRLQVRAGERSTAVVRSGTVLPIKVQTDESTGNILNLVMVEADEGTMLKVNLPIVFKGEDVCPGLKKGGFLQKIRTSLVYLCPAEHIPPKIEVDLTNLDIGDRVLMQDIPVHPSLKLLSKNETMPVCKVLSSKPAE